MAFYNLVRDNFIVNRTKADKLSLKCIHCLKAGVYESMLPFNWEKWTIDTHQEFIYMESKLTYHLLFKCKTRSVINIPKV